MGSYNAKTVSLELKRIELCDIELACTFAVSRTGAEKWKRLHDKIADILAEFDSQNIELEK